MATPYEVITAKMMDLSLDNDGKMLVWNNDTGKFDWIDQPTTIDNAVTSDSELFPQNSVIVGVNDGRKVTSTDLRFDDDGGVLSGIGILDLSEATNPAQTNTAGMMYYDNENNKLMVMLP